MANLEAIPSQCQVLFRTMGSKREMLVFVYRQLK